ncbi:hypothetical protein Xcc1_00630 [Xanthomonas campestris pv. campestris]|nr:hypothetical protein Xcc1_00630 [Xanthomonas campestris pv. campestris]
MAKSRCAQPRARTALLREYLRGASTTMPPPNQHHARMHPRSQHNSIAGRRVKRLPLSCSICRIARCNQTCAVNIIGLVLPCHHWGGVEATRMVTNEKTGPKAAKAASKVLRSGSTGKDSKTAAGSALSQTQDKSGKKK